MSTLTAPADRTMGDFLEWPPNRCLADGFYADAARSQFRRELLGEYAIKAAFRFHYEGISTALARGFAADVQKSAMAAAGHGLPAAVHALEQRLLEKPYVDSLYLYDFFSECLPAVKDAKDFVALAKHVHFIADRLGTVNALAVINGTGLVGK